MKAKMVLENINFERGQYPKTSMNLGYGKYSKDVKRLNDLLSKRGFKIRSITDPDDSKGIKDIAQWNRGSDYLVFFTFTNKLGEFYKKVYFDIDKSCEETGLEEFIISWKKEYNIDESHNFERGIELTSAIGIGRKFKLFNIPNNFYSWIEVGKEIRDNIDLLSYGEYDINNLPELFLAADGKRWFIKDKNLENRLKNWIAKYRPKIEPHSLNAILFATDNWVNAIKENIKFERKKDINKFIGIGVDRILKAGDKIEIYLQGFEMYRPEIKDGKYKAIVIDDEDYNPSYRRVKVYIPELDGFDNMEAHLSNTRFSGNSRGINDWYQKIWTVG